MIICVKNLCVNYDLINNSGIYKLFHISAPNDIYIGSTASSSYKNRISKGFSIRFNKHLSDLRKCKHHSKKLQLVVSINGLNGIRFEIIEVCNVDILKKEQYYIDLYKPTYNTIKYAFSKRIGFKHSEETKNKMSLSKIGIKFSDEHKKNIAIANKGHKGVVHSIEFRERQSIRLKKKHLNPTYNRKKILQYSLEDCFIKEWESLSHACKELKINIGNTGDCANGKRSKSGGFKWKYKN